MHTSTGRAGAVTWLRAVARICRAPDGMDTPVVVSPVTQLFMKKPTNLEYFLLTLLIRCTYNYCYHLVQLRQVYARRGGQQNIRHNKVFGIKQTQVNIVVGNEQTGVRNTISKRVFNVHNSIFTSVEAYFGSLMSGLIIKIG